MVSIKNIRHTLLNKFLCSSSLFFLYFVQLTGMQLNHNMQIGQNPISLGGYKSFFPLVTTQIEAAIPPLQLQNYEITYTGGLKINFKFIIGIDQTRDARLQNNCNYCAFLHALIVYYYAKNQDTFSDFEQFAAKRFQEIQLTQTYAKDIANLFYGISNTCMFDSAKFIPETLKKILNTPHINKLLEQKEIEFLCLKDAPHDIVSLVIAPPWAQTQSFNDSSVEKIDRAQIETQKKELMQGTRTSIIAIVALNGHFFTIVIARDKVHEKNFFVSVVNSINYYWNYEKQIFTTGFYKSSYTLLHDLEKLENLIEIVLSIKQDDFDDTSRLLVMRPPVEQNICIKTILKNVFNAITNNKEAEGLELLKQLIISHKYIKQQALLESLIEQVEQELTLLKANPTLQELIEQIRTQLHKN
jgi:hypothetical protein